MAIFRRYAAMFRVGTSFIFSSIKSRSASVTLNLICTVLLRPFMYSLLSFPFRGFGTLPNKQFSTDAPQRGRGKYGSGYPLPMLATNVFIPYALIPYYGAMPGFAKLPQKKNAAILKKRLQRSLNLIQF
ncbi:hypothetical protein [Acutalibacter sp. JLR.KK004]|uniref:hypothetical protein n=1 Tax=Acutalibacter sp. JLR.KK004 TaxID=3112622 RepID=UPI002FF17164